MQQLGPFWSVIYTTCFRDPRRNSSYFCFLMELRPLQIATELGSFTAIYILALRCRLLSTDPVFLFKLLHRLLVRSWVMRQWTSTDDEEELKKLNTKYMHTHICTYSTMSPIMPLAIPQWSPTNPSSLARITRKRRPPVLNKVQRLPVRHCSVKTLGTGATSTKAHLEI